MPKSVAQGKGECQGYKKDSCHAVLGSTSGKHDVIRVYVVSKDTADSEATADGTSLQTRGTL